MTGWMTGWMTGRRISFASSVGGCGGWTVVDRRISGRTGGLFCLSIFHPCLYGGRRWIFLILTVLYFPLPLFLLWAYELTERKASTNGAFLLNLSLLFVSLALSPPPFGLFLRVFTSVPLFASPSPATEHPPTTCTYNKQHFTTNKITSPSCFPRQPRLQPPPGNPPSLSLVG